MNASAARLCVSLGLILACTVPDARGQLSGLYQTAPGSTAVYKYHTDNLHAVQLPLNLTVSFIEGDVSPALSATIVAPIIGVTPEWSYQIAEEFPMRVTGIADNSQTYRGDLLGTQYLFEWTFQPGAGNELIMNGGVGWAGGRYEETTISNVRLIPSIAGDYNQNGTVGADDYILWRKNEGTTNAMANDPIGDVIGQVHYDQWRSNFGQSTANAATIGGAVPEPATAGLLLGALWLLFFPGRTKTRGAR
jgi:hypothetical protein